MPEPTTDLAAAYALGVLDDAEYADAATLAATDPAFKAQSALWAQRFAGHAIEELCDAAEAPPLDVWDAIASRIGAAGYARRRDEGVWFPVSPGAQMKMVMVDQATGRRSAMMRLEPGTVFPSHGHEDLEECLVMEGELEINGTLYGPGDFVLAQAGSRHDDIPTRTGATVMLTWSRA